MSTYRIVIDRCAVQRLRRLRRARARADRTRRLRPGHAARRRDGRREHPRRRGLLPDGRDRRLLTRKAASRRHEMSERSDHRRRTRRRALRRDAARRRLRRHARPGRCGAARALRASRPLEGASERRAGRGIARSARRDLWPSAGIALRLGSPVVGSTRHAGARSRACGENPLLRRPGDRHGRPAATASGAVTAARRATTCARSRMPHGCAAGSSPARGSRSSARA